ncbi:uncharacterized protein Tco025E_09862, partial [Trypanosoma conorhini]
EAASPRRGLFGAAAGGAWAREEGEGGGGRFRRRRVSASRQGGGTAVAEIGAVVVRAARAAPKKRRSRGGEHVMAAARFRGARAHVAEFQRVRGVEACGRRPLPPLSRQSPRCQGRGSLCWRWGCGPHKCCPGQCGPLSAATHRCCFASSSSFVCAKKRQGQGDAQQQWGFRGGQSTPSLG